MDLRKILDKILDDHAQWLRGTSTGRRADLRSANLHGADLEGANLWGADLRSANLHGANLHGADLEGANLRSANLWGADLRSANLWGADLRSANLWSANLWGADLHGADLEGANLRSANLWGADLRSANLSPFQIPDGDLVGWKKITGGVIVEMRIPYRAKRTASLVGRKCRAEFAEVVRFHGSDAQEILHKAPNGTKIIYRLGQTVVPDSYDDDFRVECTHGIHFFCTRTEAEGY